MCGGPLGAQVLLCSGVGSTIYRLSEEGCAEHPLGLLPPSPVVLVRVSPCGNFLAVLTADGRLVVTSAGARGLPSSLGIHACLRESWVTGRTHPQ